MKDNLTPQETREEIEELSNSSLPESTIRAVLYLIIAYALTSNFPSLSWMWYALGAYLIFDIGCLLYMKYMVYKFKRDHPVE